MGKNMNKSATMRNRKTRARKKIIKIDYDKTIERADYPDVGKPVPLAIDTIIELSETYILILDTCRHDEQLSDAVAYLGSMGVCFDYVNENTAHSIAVYGDTRKIYADYSIDDKNLFTPMLNGCVDWNEIRKAFGMRSII